MKYLIYFENIEQGREIDLQQLWNDMIKYNKKLSFYRYGPEMNFHHLLNKILKLQKQKKN